MRGVDVAKYQGVIDWGRAFAHGVEFAIAKATQGMAEVDDQFGRNSAELRRLGYRRGFYHFPDARNDPAKEAKRFLGVVGKARGEVRALDVENDPGRPDTAGIFNHADPSGWVLKWCEVVADACGVPPLVYMSAGRLSEFDWSGVVKADCGLWVADWTPPLDDVSPWPFAAVWQDGNRARFPGIAADVDSDVFNGGPGQWDAYAGVGADPVSLPKPKPKPKPPAPAPAVHVVVPGDTLSELADRFGVTTDLLVAWNVHSYPTLATDPGMIWPGWRLVVGVSGHGEPSHVVVGGDTLSGIAASWGVDLADVERANPQLGPPHRNFNVILPGDVVRRP